MTQLAESSPPIYDRLMTRWRNGSVTRDHGIDLMDQLEGLLSAGLPLDRALHILGGALEIPAMKSLVVNLLLDIEKGATLSEAFASHPEAFDTLDVNMIRAGEEGGILPIVLRRLVDFQHSRQEFKRFLLVSSIYPAALFMFGLFAVGGILLFVLPKFVEVYSDLATASVSTRILIDLSNALQAYGWAALAILIAVILGLRYWGKTPSGRIHIQAMLLRLPGMGDLILKSELSRVLQTLGVLLGAGVPILKAVRLSRALTRYEKLDSALAEAERSLREGQGLARPLLNNPLFPRLVGQMAVVGEESGSLDRMLLKVAQRLEIEVRSRLRALMAMLEPGLIIGIGLVIGLVVVSMISAILSLNEMPL
ncbi:MAG: type II secretion system F family protein [Proteobacteria bacterium]|nr:type II secretion system F family protein [Pseudomonadota bacterium]